MHKTTLIGLVVFSFISAAIAEEMSGDETVAGKNHSGNLQKLFPDPSSIDQGLRVKDYKEYHPGSLWDYINGGADAYLDLGFVKVGTREYVIELDQEAHLTVDVYDMGSREGAYGIYCGEANPQAAALEVGVAGYLSGSSATFWSQRYYVTIRTDHKHKAITGIMKKMSTQVSTRIGEPGRLPVEVNLFPQGDQAKAGQRFAFQNLLGVSELAGFSCRYKKNEETLTLHLCHFPSQDQAQRGWEGFCKRLRTPPLQQNSHEFTYSDKYLGDGRLIRQGTYFAIAQGFTPKDEKSSWALGLFKEFRERITKAVASEKEQQDQASPVKNSEAQN